MFANLISLNSFIDKISLITNIVSYIVLRSYLSIALLTLCKVLFFNEETTTSKLLPVIETMTTSPKSSLIVYLTRFLPAPLVESEETFLIKLIDKKNKIEENSNREIMSKIQDENEDIVKKDFVEPSCMKDKEERSTAVRKGLLIHFILQNLDFNSLNTKSDIKEYIEKLVYNNVITEQDKKYINITRIYNYLNHIKRKIKKRKRILILLKQL